MRDALMEMRHWESERPREPKWGRAAVHQESLSLQHFYLLDRLSPFSGH